MDVVSFEVGAMFGMCMTVVLMLVFMTVFGEEDDDE